MTPMQNAALRPRFSHLLILITLLALVAFSAPARAQVSFSLLSPYQAGNAGDTLSYTGTLTNQGSEEIFLNGAFFNLASDDLTGDESPFFINFPLSLGGGESFTGEILTVAIGPTTPQGLYLGTFSIVGGPSDGDFNTLATQTFGVAVGAPEPATGLLLLVGATTFGTIAHRRRMTA